MRIVDKNNIVSEAVETICSKAKYQKVVFCYDETSDIKVMESIIAKLGRDVVVFKYYYTKDNIETFFDFINNGVRVAVYNVSIQHFYRLQNNNTFILNIFLPQEDFILPYMSNMESIYGENLLACDTDRKDNLSILFLYQLGLYMVWKQILQYQEVDTGVFRQIDMLVKSKDGFYNNLLSVFTCLKSEMGDDYKYVEIFELPQYIYLQICATLKMLENIYFKKEQYIDFEKEGLTQQDVDKAYRLIVKYNIIDLIKFNNTNLIKLTTVILNRLKVLIKKYFNFKNVKLNKLNKLIKKQAKCLNIDKLLYISFIFNAI